MSIRRGGETHILKNLSVIERGITLIFILLPTLLADVMHKLEHAATTWGNVSVYHLDELFNSNRSAFARLLRQCLLIERNTPCSLFMFLSPQFLINHRDALDVFVSCAHERTLQLIAMDETHIHVQHRTSFRDDILALRVEFFSRVLGNLPADQRPRLITLLLIFPTAYLWLLSNLLTVDFTIDNCILRGSPSDFSQWEIKMKFCVGRTPRLP